MADEDFLQPAENRDFALLVEGTKVYVNREFLAYYSPVLHKIFFPEGAPFKQPEGGMLMKEKKLDEFLQFLQAVFPTEKMMNINGSNLATLVAYSDEYDVKVLRQRCVKFIGKQLKKGELAGEVLIDYLRLASLYNNKDLQKEIVPLVSQLSIGEITEAHTELPTAILSAVYQAKALTLQTALDSTVPLPEGAIWCGGCQSKTCSISKGASSCCNKRVWILASAVAEIEANWSFTCSHCRKLCSLKGSPVTAYRYSSCCNVCVFVHPKSDGRTKQLSAAAIAKAADFSVDLLDRNQ